jgi:hypothetical protein
MSNRSYLVFCLFLMAVIGVLAYNMPRTPRSPPVIIASPEVRTVDTPVSKVHSVKLGLLIDGKIGGTVEFPTSAHKLAIVVADCDKWPVLFGRTCPPLAIIDLDAGQLK